MSSRFGWMIVDRNLKSQQDDLLEEFRPGMIAIQKRKTNASEHLMRKVDDDLELCLAYGRTFTLIQGQYDLGLSSFEKLDDLCRRYSTNSMALWLTVEGTSGTYIFKKFKGGKLVQSYASYEGIEAEAECLGSKPEIDDQGEIGEWELVKEIEKEGISHDAICQLEFEIYNFPETKPPPTGANQKW